MDLFTDVAFPAMVEELEKIALAGGGGILSGIGKGFRGWQQTGLRGGLSQLAKVYEQGTKAPGMARVVGGVKPPPIPNAALTPFQRFRQGAGAVMNTQMGQAGAAALGGGALLAATPYAAYRMGQSRPR